MSKYRITLDGKTYEMEIELMPEGQGLDAGERHVYKDYKDEQKDPTIRIIGPTAQRTTVSRTGTVKAPMPGTILNVIRGEGEMVQANQVVLVLEAMKMENEITAPMDGVITKMNCTTGDVVASGDVLFLIE